PAPQYRPRVLEPARADHHGRLNSKAPGRPGAFSCHAAAEPAPRLHGATAARRHGCTAPRLHRRHGCTAPRLHGATAARRHGCTGATAPPMRRAVPSAAELAAKDLRGLARVGLSARLAHHLPHEEANQLLLTAAETLRL